MPWRWSCSQAGLPTVGKLIDHIFLVERRILQRLMGEELSKSTGLTGNNVPPLFDYGASVRRELEQYAGRSRCRRRRRDADVRGSRSGNGPMTSRKLLFHILIHEIRHWAQIALAVRLAGHEPPGEHDLFFSQVR